MYIKPFHILYLILILGGCKNTPPPELELLVKTQPSVSFTFDDGITSNLANFKFEDWNQKILSTLEEENLKAVFFVTGSNKLWSKGQFLLKSWNDQGHRIANHTYTHPNFNAEKHNAAFFEQELLQTDSIISKYSNHVKLFRFPFLKEGQNPSKVDSIRSILANHQYTNGYVTIDASDWFVNSRLIQKIEAVGFENAEIDKYKDFYIQHIFERAQYYENLSMELHNRHIKHTLLLHHNLTSALFLKDLIQKFKEEGWEFNDAELAFKDMIFQKNPAPEYAGESLIWSLAKQSGNYKESLRYPAEDSRYETPKMDSLGL